MARPQRPWFRVYVEMMRDPKIRRLSPSQRWLWVGILAAARESCISGYLMISERVPFSWQDLSDYVGMSVKEVEKGTDLMSDLGMIAFDPERDAWFVPRWSERQFESDDVTQRTAKHRSKPNDRNVPTLFVGTSPETDTESETDKTPHKPPNPESSNAHGPPSAAKRVTAAQRREKFLAKVEAWTPDAVESWFHDQRGTQNINLIRAVEEFKDYCRSHEDKVYSDLNAAFRNRIRNTLEGKFTRAR